jgi:hypothetical protein
MACASPATVAPVTNSPNAMRLRTPQMPIGISSAATNSPIASRRDWRCVVSQAPAMRNGTMNTAEGRVR